MADAFGAIIVGFTDDFVGNKIEIAKALTALPLSRCGVEFEVDGITIRTVTRSSLWYPTLSLHRPKIVVTMVDDRDVRKHVDDLTEDELDNIVDVIEYEPIPLGEIANMLAEHIDNGSLILTCCAHEEQSALYSEILTVDADGCAYRQELIHSTGNVLEFSEERYSPIAGSITPTPHSLTKLDGVIGINPADALTNDR